MKKFLSAFLFIVLVLTSAVVVMADGSKSIKIANYSKEKGETITTYEYNGDTRDNSEVREAYCPKEIEREDVSFTLDEDETSIVCDSDANQEIQQASSVVSVDGKDKEIHAIAKWSKTEGESVYNYEYTPVRRDTPYVRPAYQPESMLTESITESERGSVTSQIQVNAHNYPYATVGQIVSKFDKNQDGTIDTITYGTGYLEAEDIILTAAHNIYDTVSNIWAEEVIFHPAQNSDGDTYSSAYDSEVIDMSIAVDYINHSAWSPVNDWAICQLDDDLGNRFGYLGLSGEPRVGMSLTISGYPGRTPEQVANGVVGGVQYKTQGMVTSIDTDLYFKTSNYSKVGYSGGPVYDADYISFGILTTSISVVGDTNNANSGCTRFVDWLFEMIIEECEASAERWS